MAAPMNTLTEVNGIKEKIEKSLLSAKGDVFLEKSMQRCLDLITKLEARKDQSQFEKLSLQEYAQILLDYTYYHESKLVNEEFPEENGEERMNQILGDLEKPIELATENMGKEGKISEVLGEEITECLLWRKGALLYMYTCTVNEKQERVNKNKQQFLQYLMQGILYLKSMLQVRLPLSDDSSEIIANDKTTVQLLQKGIFSDTHCLALMYAGEMCYWFRQNSDSKTQDSLKQFNAKEIGLHMLENYIELIKGPLRGKGWTCDRAEELVKHLQAVQS